jgi:hypothetical protein
MPHAYTEDQLVEQPTIELIAEPRSDWHGALIKSLAALRSKYLF